jgi:hypothetical protein
VARTLVIPPSLVQRDRAGVIAAAADFIQDVSRRFLIAMSRAQREEGRRSMLALECAHLWTTRDEMETLLKRQTELFERYLQPRGLEGEEERTIIWLVYPTAADEESHA